MVRTDLRVTAFSSSSRFSGSSCWISSTPSEPRTSRRFPGRTRLLTLNVEQFSRRNGERSRLGCCFGAPRAELRTKRTDHPVGRLAPECQRRERRWQHRGGRAPRFGSFSLIIYWLSVIGDHLRPKAGVSAL